MQSVDGVSGLIVCPNNFIGHSVDAKAWLALRNVVEDIEALDVMPNHVQKVLVKTKASKYVQKHLSPGVDELPASVAEIRGEFEGHQP